MPLGPPSRERAAGSVDEWQTQLLPCECRVSSLDGGMPSSGQNAQCIKAETSMWCCVLNGKDT